MWRELRVDAFIVVVVLLLLRGKDLVDVIRPRVFENSVAILVDIDFSLSFLLLLFFTGAYIRLFSWVLSSEMACCAAGASS